MLKYLEKTLYFGLGLVTYSAEKIEGLVNELVKKGEVASEDAKNLVNELIEKGENQKEAIRKFVQEEVTKLQAKKPDFVTRDELREIIREELARHNEKGEQNGQVKETAEE